jgi:hypothetical protein
MTATVGGLLWDELIKDWIFAMADQFKFNGGIGREQNGSSRSSPCFSNAPEEAGLNKRYVDITAMIRSLQRTEGTTDCFRSGLADCEQRECSWRQYCLESTDDELLE